MRGKETVVTYLKQTWGKDIHKRAMKLSSQFTDDMDHNLGLFRAYELFKHIVVNVSRKFTDSSEYPKYSDIPPAVTRSFEGVIQEFVSKMIEDVRAQSQRMGADAFAEAVAEETGNDLKIYDIKA